MKDEVSTHHDKSLLIPMKVLGCVLLVFVVVIAIRVFNLSLGNVLTYSILLACPILHLIMMRNGEHKH